MGNKIITEKDFFECSGGMMPSPFQARQPIVKRQDGAKYITKDDISTVSWVDFGCKKVMLLYAVVAAVAVAVAALCVATGGAALIAMCAIAGAAGAILGAIVGTLICGQLVAPTRKWIGSKSNFKIQGINTISGDHYIQCDAFTYLGMSPEFVRFNPQIKTWSQAIAKGGAAFIGNVFEGMMAGAAIGGIAAGGAALFGSGSWAGAGNVTLQFLKSIPKNIAGNIIESYMLPGLGIRGVMTAQNVAAGYGETGEFSASQAMSDAKDGFFGMELGTVDSFKNISTGNGTWQDYTGLALNLMPVGKGTRDLLDGKKKSKVGKREGEAPSKIDETDTTKPKAKTEGDAPTKKVEGDAYEVGKNKGLAKKQAYAEMQKILDDIADGILGKRQIPQSLEVAVHKTTGEVIIGKNKGAKKRGSIHEKTKDKFKEGKKENWDELNCSEADVSDQIHKKGHNPNDYEYHAVEYDKKTGEIRDKHTCRNCDVNMKEQIENGDVTSNTPESKARRDDNNSMYK